jgi:hypothetical protein
MAPDRSSSVRVASFSKECSNVRGQAICLAAHTDAVVTFSDKTEPSIQAIMFVIAVLRISLLKKKRENVIYGH